MNVEPLIKQERLAELTEKQSDRYFDLLKTIIMADALKNGKDGMKTEDLFKILRSLE